MRRLLAALLLAAAPVAAQNAGPSSPPTAPEGWLTRSAAEIVVLDKVRAQPTAQQMKLGQTVTFGTMSVTLRGCVTRPADVPADSAAFLDVIDPRATGADFHGWIFANTPAVSQLQHPLYDIRVVACR